MKTVDSTLRAKVGELVVANWILAHEGVVDVFGHVSMRHPSDPGRYLLSHSRSPELVTADDIVEFTLDGEASDLRGRTPYGERVIHGAIYEARPDVGAVVHHHARELIPFTVTSVPLRPITHTSAPIGAEIPVWDMRDRFGDTDNLVETAAHGRDLACCLGDAKAVLMRGHGCVAVGATLPEAVYIAIHLQINARDQIRAMQMGTPVYLTPGEIEKAARRMGTPLALGRAWEYWCSRAGCGVPEVSSVALRALAPA